MGWWPIRQLSTGGKAARPSGGEIDGCLGPILAGMPQFVASVAPM